MEVSVRPAQAEAVRFQLQQLYEVETRPFVEIVADYLCCAQRTRDLQVRNAQLEKEAAELRTEAQSLQAAAERAQVLAGSSEKVVELEKKMSELQLELSATYKDKAKQADDLLQATSALGVVRESHERQSRELAEAEQRAKELKARVKDLGAQVDHERAAHALATSELEARLADRDAAQERAAELKAENAELVKRLIELKDSEVERMNEVNRMCDEMIRNARQMERAAAAQASAADTRVALTGAKGLGALGDRLRRLTGSGGLGAAADAAVVEPAEPAAVVAPKSVVPTSLQQRLAAHEGGCFALAFDRPGSRLATCGADKTVKVWDASGGYLLNTLHGMVEGVLDVSYTCDQRHVVGAGNDGSLRVWDPTTGRARHTLTGHTGKVTSAECSPMDPKTVASGGMDRCLKVWDLGRGVCRQTIMCHSSCNGLSLTMDGGLIASGHFDGALRLWDVRSGKLAHEVSGLHTQQICSVQVGLLGGAILTLGKDNALKLVDVRSFEVRKALRGQGFVVGGVLATACLGPDEKHAAAGSSDGTVFVWDLEAGGVVGRLKEPEKAVAVTACCWSPQGTPLVSAGKGGAITFWHDTAADKLGGARRQTSI